MSPAGVVDETTAAGPTDLPPLDPRAYPEAEVLPPGATPVDTDRSMHPFEALQRKILTGLDVQVTPGSLMLCSDLLNSVHQLEFVDKDILEEQAARIVELRERENPQARQMWGPTAIKIARKGLEMRLNGEADLLVPKAV